MKSPVLIVGHGLAGCVLAMSMWRRQIPFRIIGKSMKGEASMASSGLITPVTGRKYVKSWMIDEFLAAAHDFYTWTENLFDKKYYHATDIIRFLSHPEAIAAWEKRIPDPEYAGYISPKRNEVAERSGRPYGIITGGYRLDAPEWIGEVRKFLKEEGLFEERLYDPEKDKEEIIVFATGAIKPFPSAGLIPNKGEALLVRMPDWPYKVIIKEEVFFIPLKKDLYWVGSYYQPWPDDPAPSAEGKQMLLDGIEKVHKGKIEVIEHMSGVRPTIDDRRPLIGPWPGQDGKFLFNGMGTKGTSLAPYWAGHLIDHLDRQTAIADIVHPKRYSYLQQSG